jgi:hypothetical protein
MSSHTILALVLIVVFVGSLVYLQMLSRRNRNKEKRKDE